MKEKILVIEDEQKIADAIVYALKREGYTVEVVYHGDEAIHKLQEFGPEAIILDVMLPGMDGYEILKKLQDKGRIGVIMLTAKEDIVNKILGLELGADDYMTKPFDMRELLARLKSLLRRMQKAENKKDETEINLRGIELHVSHRTAYAGERALDLTPKEYDLLKLLLSSPERVFTREIADTGIGIAKEAINKIFEPFYMVDKNRSRQSGGTGLGLSLVKKYTNMQGGTVTLIRSESDGTTFRISFPESQPD